MRLLSGAFFPQALLLLVLGYFPAATILTVPVTVRSQIFVLEENDGVVAEYTNSGMPINVSLISGLHFPFGIAESEGNLYVANSGTGVIGKYTTSGATINASLISGLPGPIALTISGPDLFVASYGIASQGTGTIGKYTTSGDPVDPLLITGLNGPFGLAISGGYIYVVNQNSGTVGKYTTSGEIVNSSLITGLQSPRGIAASGDDLYVVTQRDGALGKYTTSGATVNTRLADVHAPEAIVISQGNLFVTNSAPNSVAEYTCTGQLLNDSLISNLHGPTGIDVLPHQLQLVTAISRKSQGTAGTFDIDLPLVGSRAGVECRNGNGLHTFLFAFNNNVINGNATVTGGIGVVSEAPSFFDNSMIVKLSGVTDAQAITVTLSEVTDDAGQTLLPVEVRASMLIGDATANMIVDSSDITQIKSQTGTVVTESNFREDITGDGIINSSDIALAKSRSGAGILIGR